MKISFSRLGNHGRLGNQMFQIAGTLGVASQYGAEVALPEWKYSQYFDHELPTGTMAQRQVNEKHFHHHDWQLTGDSDLLGYLQTEKYFTSREDVLNLFKFKPEFAAAVSSKVPSWVWGKETICFQIRRTDYVGNPNYYQLSISYYIDALLTHFPDWHNYNIVFFSDDISYCKINFGCMANAYFCENLSDIEQMCLATMLDHFIIPNSSFGWWCAWLGEKDHSKIIHCGHLQAGKLLERNDPKDYWPERWTRHEKAHYKIDLKDVTFTIPVFYDHEDRAANLSLCVSWLLHHFDTNIIVMEQKHRYFERFQQWAKYMHFNNDLFHRTKMLNQMAEAANTPYIANWDADVLIPPFQLYLTVLQLRKGADFMYPYDGTFIRLPRNTNFADISKFLDVGMAKHGVTSTGSVGGAVLANRAKFMEAGGENENMISYGPEDVERWERWHKLGYFVGRIAGNLYHMNHFVGRNSSTSNPYFKANHVELEKERAMSKEELQAYIDEWPWFSQYTPGYYKRISEGSARSAKHVFKALADIGIKPKSVQDVGCGIGAWYQDGIEWSGIDYGVPKAAIVPGVKVFDFDLRNVAILDPLQFDLNICMEVAEHLPESVAADLVAFLCKSSDTVLFSAAIPNQGGEGHINEQWQSYWAKLFADNGFGPAKKQPDIRNNPKIEMWYRQNTVLYVKGGKGNVTDFVLPEYYMEITKHLKAVK